MINIEENKGLDITMLPSHPKHFIKIPKEIILNQELSEHRVFAFLYLIYNQTLENNVHYSSQYMIQWCGYKPVWNRSRKENIHTKFKDCMNWFLDNEYISELENELESEPVEQSNLAVEEDLFQMADDDASLDDMLAQMENPRFFYNNLKWEQ